MTPFFRRIRQKLANDNKFLKYSRYAIGEILLVVVGILIALQINNWNEHRKAQKQEYQMISQLLEDAKTDSIFYDSRLTLFKNQLNSYEALINYCDKLDFNDDSMRFSQGQVPFTMAASQSNIMSNKNEYTTIINNEIKNSLRDYTISYSYITKAIDLHTDIVGNELYELTKKSNLELDFNEINIHSFASICDDENITGRLQLCYSNTRNTLEQTERFLKDNKKLITVCKAYLNDKTK